MNITKLSGLLLIASLTLFAAGCAPATPSPTPTPEPTATEQPTQTPEPTATESPTPEITETPADVTPQATVPGAGAGAQPAGQGAPAGSTAEDQYVYVSQTLADGYQVRPRTVVTISWTVKNPGPTAWGTDYSLRYFAGPEVTNTYVAFPKIVSANESTQLTVTFTTPDAPGDYDLWYKLVNNQGQNFGDVNFAFTVTNTPNYGAPKPSATP